jgi:D-alanyl-D-alanine carboxypeptidase/D-alanyl-D-alanine-endopeptidase (penicillin-binding protein 4)
MAVLLTAVTVATVPEVAAAASASPHVRALHSLDRTLAGDLRHAGGAGSAEVLDTTTGQTLFASAATAARLPASVEKLYTTSTALLRFGPAATFKTRIWGVGQLGSDGVWHGTLYLRGGGDPTFGDAAFDHAAYGGTGATVQSLASALAARGIKGIQGSVIGDESLFDSLRGTPAEDYRPNLEVEGELSALAFDAGFSSSRETALQRRPALFAAQALVSALRHARIRVSKPTRITAGYTPRGAQLLASVSSPPLSKIIELTNSPSDNFFAEMLLKDLGARFGGAGTTAAGAAVVRSFIAQHFGLYPRLEDGSGLSRYDRSTAAGVVALLRAMQSDLPFENSLAIAGVRGTMQDEMLGTRAVDNCRGKTGTLSDAANLVGYCTAAGGDDLIFAFFLNGVTNTYAGHALEDKMGVALANYDPATGQG